MTTTQQATAAASVGRAGRRRRWVWLLLLGIAAVLTAVVLGAGFGRDPSVVDSVLLKGPAPPLAGPTLGGGRFNLAEHRGDVVLVNVWASWCVPCRREYPLLAEADRRLYPLGLRIVGIDTQDTVADATAFLNELGGENFPSVLDPDGRLAVEWGTFGVPETFVVDRDGLLVAKRVGELSPSWIVDRVIPLLRQR
ncbi:MAG: redoxin domain-containing protein [Actinomycetota bacterium]|nr:redoxin domain-containing protein [Actinomycetota bacterium]